jgi:hypothetical protein
LLGGHRLGWRTGAGEVPPNQVRHWRAVFCWDRGAHLGRLVDPDNLMGSHQPGDPFVVDHDLAPSQFGGDPLFATDAVAAGVDHLDLGDQCSLGNLVICRRNTLALLAIERLS